MGFWVVFGHVWFEGGECEGRFRVKQDWGVQGLDKVVIRERWYDGCDDDDIHTRVFLMTCITNGSLCPGERLRRREGGRVERSSNTLAPFTSDYSRRLGHTIDYIWSSAGIWIWLGRREYWGLQVLYGDVFGCLVWFQPPIQTVHLWYLHYNVLLGFWNAPGGVTYLNVGGGGDGF